MSVDRDGWAGRVNLPTGPAPVSGNAWTERAGTFSPMTSMAPGQVSTPDSLLLPAELAAASDIELAQTGAAVLAEQHQRALAGNDLGALLEEAFVQGFSSDGKPNIPWIVGGLLLCPGYKRMKSATSHDCTFTSVDGTWSWDHDNVVLDEMRTLPGPKAVKQSISILTVVEGMGVDSVEATSKQGSECQMKKATSYQVRAGELALVATRARASAQGHRGS